MDDFNVETEACDVESKIIMTNFLSTKQSQQTRLVNDQTNLIKLYEKLSSNTFTCTSLALKPTYRKGLNLLQFCFELQPLF